MVEKMGAREENVVYFVLFKKEKKKRYCLFNVLVHIRRSYERMFTLWIVLEFKISISKKKDKLCVWLMFWSGSPLE